jgi:hypothetical protein
MNRINVFAGKVRKTGFFQKAGFPGNSDRIFGIYLIPWVMGWRSGYALLTRSNMMTGSITIPLRIAGTAFHRPCGRHTER